MRRIGRIGILGAFSIVGGVMVFAVRTARSQAGGCTTDADGDGHRSIACGGDDCDDGDPNRYPGNHEVCDAEGHDEDCDATTFGARDFDRDGETDLRCCNFGDPTMCPGTKTYTNVSLTNPLCCGTDWDDSNPAIRTGVQVCNGADQVFSFLVGNVAIGTCPAGTKCVPQPNGSGVCMVPPPGYSPPGAFPMPPPPQIRTPLPSYKVLLPKRAFVPPPSRPLPVFK